MKVVAGKNGVTRYICTNRDCRHSEDVEESKLPEVIAKNKEKNKA